MSGNIRRTPLPCQIVVCVDSTLLGLYESVGDGEKIWIDFRKEAGTYFEGSVDLGHLRFAGRFHRIVVKTTTELVSQFGARPVGSCFRDEEMENGVISRRDGPAKTRLVDVFGVQSGDARGQFQQLSGKFHRLDQSRLFQLGLVRLAAEIEVGKYAPTLQRLDFLHDGAGGPVCLFQEAIRAGGGILKNDHEEDGWLTGPVVTESGIDAKHGRSELTGGPLDLGLKLRLLNKCRRNLHISHYHASR